VPPATPLAPAAAPLAPARAPGGPDRRIHTPDTRLRVFVSSTLGELAPEREAVRTAIRTLRLTPVMFELGARPHPPQELYRSYLEQSDVFVGIYGRSYGWVAPGADVSGIEDEYRLSGDRPKLLYLKQAEDREERLERLLDRIRDEGRAAYKPFTTPGELAELLVDDLALLVTERFHAADEDASLPRGTLTFLHADVVGSSDRAARDGERWASRLAGHQTALRAGIEAAGGRLVDTDGDKTLAVFTDASSAARAALAVHRRPDTLPVRIGLHTGQGTTDGRRYAGLDVHRTVRLTAAAHGGQTLVSEVTQSLLASLVGSEGWVLTPLGSFALRGRTRTEAVWQLTDGDGPVVFPPVRAQRAARIELPVPPTPLVDRERDVAELVARLRRAEVRLVTLTGPGGIGKTRVAIEAASRVAACFPDGVVFVDLAAVDDPAAVIPTVADALGAPPHGQTVAALVHTIGAQRLLLVLDNLEQVTGAATELGELLAACPGLAVLATSRVVLRLRGEWEQPIGPLAVPPPGHDDPADVLAAPAVELLLARAQQVRPGDVPGPEDAPTLAAIARALEGVPLAIELAAARLRLLPLDELRRRLDRSLDTLAGGLADLPPRQRTLRATIDWSYELLDEPTRRVLRSLGVASGGLPLAAAEAMCIDLDDDVTSALAALVESSLVTVEPTSDGPRLTMLVSIRDRAAELLDEAGEYELARDRHAAWFAQLAATQAEALRGHGQQAALQVLSREWSNLETAAAWFVERGDCEAVVSLAHDLWVALWVEARVAEADGWLRALPAPCEHMGALAQARYAWLVGGLAFERGDYPRAHEALETAIVALEPLDDRGTLAWATFARALVLPALDAPAETVLAAVEAAVAGFRDVDDPWGEGWAVLTLGILTGGAGDLEGARVLHQRARALARDVGSPLLLGQVELQLGLTEAGLGRLPDAHAHLAAAVEILERQPLRELLAYTLEALAVLAFRTDEAAAGMVALGAAGTIRSRASLHTWPSIAPLLGVLYAHADAMDDPELQRARADGRLLDPMRAVHLALEATRARCHVEDDG
jgi:predicted ATPase/class 3 adenylate cyclase